MFILPANVLQRRGIVSKDIIRVWTLDRVISLDLTFPHVGVESDVIARKFKIGIHEIFGSKDHC